MYNILALLYSREYDTENTLYDIFDIITSEDIDHEIIVFKMAMFVRAANQFSPLLFSPLFKEKTTCLCRKK